MNVEMFSRRPKARPRRVDELERRLRLEDVRRELIDRAQTWDELSRAQAYGEPPPPLPWGQRASVFLTGGAAVFAALVVIIVATSHTSPGGVQVPDPDSGRAHFAKQVIDNWNNTAIGYLNPLKREDRAGTAYLVPLDRVATGMYASDYGFDVKPIAFFLNKRFAWRTIVSQPLKVSVKDFDGKRAEMNADLLVEQLENAVREYGVPSRPFVVIGYTSLPMFSPSSPASPYIYMRHSALGQGGIAVISTTHLSAAANTVMQQRLMKITLRAIGLYVLHRKLTFDDWSVMHLPLDSAADLDLMRPVFDHAPHTAIVNP